MKQNKKDTVKGKISDVARIEPPAAHLRPACCKSMQMFWNDVN